MKHLVRAILVRLQVEAHVSTHSLAQMDHAHFSLEYG